MEKKSKLCLLWLSLSAAARIQNEGDKRYQKQVLIAVILALVGVIVMAVSATYARTFWRKARQALDSNDIKLQSEVLKLQIPESVVQFMLVPFVTYVLIGVL